MKTNDIQAKIKKLQAEQNATENLMAVLPTEFQNPDLLVWHNSKLSEFSLHFYVTNLDEAKTWVNRWAKFTLPLRLSKGLFTSFLTDAHNDDNGASRGCNVTNTPVNPVTVKVDKWGLKFELYALVEGHLLRIAIEFKHGSAFQQYAGVQYRLTGSGDYKRVESQRLFAPAFVGHNQIRWASGSNDCPSSYTIYWNANTKFEDIFS